MSKVPFFHSTKLTIGLFLVILGLYLFGKEMGWITTTFPFWPVILVAFGAFVAAGELSR